jgi:hypothetical protein
MTASPSTHLAAPPRVLSRGEKILIGVSLALALLFGVGGVTKLFLPPPDGMQALLGDFVWVRWPIGVLELVAACLLLRPRTVTLACTVIGLVAVCFVVLILVAGAPMIRLLIPSTILLVVGTVGYIRRPAAQTVSRLRPVLDWYAQEQLDQRRQAKR